MADLNSTLVRGNLRVTDDADINGNVNASTFNGLPLSGSTGANTIPIRDSNGYAYFNYINTNVGTENPSSYSGVTLLFSGSDGWIRKASPSNISVGYATSAGSATDSTKIPLAGSTSITGSLVPNATDSADLGGGSKRWNNIYGKNIIVSTSSGKFELQGPNSTCATMKVDDQDGDLKFTLVDNQGSASGTYTLTNTGSNATIATQTWVGNQGYITSSGSCSYASSAGNADTVDNKHASDFTPYYATSSDIGVDNLPMGITSSAIVQTGQNAYNHSVFMYFTNVGTPFQLQFPDSSENYIYKRYNSGGTWSSWSKMSAGYADSAGSVAWSNISGRPTNVSAFTNDSGYITSSGSCAYATSAGSATDSTKIPLSGTSSLTGSIIPSTNSTSGSTGVDLGSSSKYFKKVYTRDLTVKNKIQLPDTGGGSAYAELSCDVYGDLGIYVSDGDHYSIWKVPFTGSDSTKYLATEDDLKYLTTAPTSANTSGKIKIVILSSEPSTKYNGYIYIITG